MPARIQYPPSYFNQISSFNNLEFLRRKRLELNKYLPNGQYDGHKGKAISMLDLKDYIYTTYNNLATFEWSTDYLENITFDCGFYWQFANTEKSPLVLKLHYKQNSLTTSFSWQIVIPFPPSKNRVVGTILKTNHTKANLDNQDIEFWLRSSQDNSLIGLGSWGTWTAYNNAIVYPQPSNSHFYHSISSHSLGYQHLHLYFKLTPSSSNSTADEAYLWFAIQFYNDNDLPAYPIDVDYIQNSGIILS